MGWRPLDRLGSEQISILICIVLSAGLWFTLQFSKSYLRWVDYPLELSVSELDEQASFALEPARIRLRQSGWTWAFQGDASAKPTSISLESIREVKGDRNEVIRVLLREVGADEEDILEVEGLDQLLSVGSYTWKKLPISILLPKEAAPSGFVWSESQRIHPDSIYLLAPAEQLKEISAWGVSLQEDAQVIQDRPISLTLENDRSSEILLSTRTIDLYPVLDQLTEKKWEIPVFLPDSLASKFIPIPRMIELTVRIPTQKFDDDSLKMIEAVLSDTYASNADDIQMLHPMPLPSYVTSWRMSPPFVTVFRFEE